MHAGNIGCCIFLRMRLVWILFLKWFSCIFYRMSIYFGRKVTKRACGKTIIVVQSFFCTFFVHDKIPRAGWMSWSDILERVNRAKKTPGTPCTQNLSNIQCHTKKCFDRFNQRRLTKTEWIRNTKQNKRNKTIIGLDISWSLLLVISSSLNFYDVLSNVSLS